MSTNYGVKRKRVVLTIADKLDIIKQLESGVAPANISDQYNIGISTISNIRHKKDELMKFSFTQPHTKKSKLRKTMKSCEMTDEEIVSSITNITNTPPASVDESEDEIEMPEIKVPTHSEAIHHLEQSLIYLEAANDADPMHITVLRLLREQVADKRRTTLKQKDIKSFFKIE